MDKTHIELGNGVLIFKYGWHHLEVPITNTLYNRAQWWMDDYLPMGMSKSDIHTLITRFGNEFDWLAYGFNPNENYKYHLLDLAVMNNHDIPKPSVHGIQLHMHVNQHQQTQGRAYALITLDYLLHGCPITVHLHPLISEGSNRLSLSHHEYHGDVSIDIIYEQWEMLKLLNTFFSILQSKIYPCRDKLKNYELPLHDIHKLYPSIDILKEDLQFFTAEAVEEQKTMIAHGSPKLLQMIHKSRLSY